MDETTTAGAADARMRGGRDGGTDIRTYLGGDQTTRPVMRRANSANNKLSTATSSRDGCGEVQGGQSDPQWQNQKRSWSSGGGEAAGCRRAAVPCGWRSEDLGILDVLVTEQARRDNNNEKDFHRTRLGLGHG